MQDPGVVRAQLNSRKKVSESVNPRKGLLAGPVKFSRHNQAEGAFGLLIVS